MGSKKIRAVNLRKIGKSYAEISRELGIAKSTLSNWFKNQKWSQAVRNKLVENNKAGKVLKLHTAHEKYWQNKYQEYRAEAYLEFKKFRNQPLFIAGTMLYWSEGDNNMRTSIVRLTNTDCRMLNIFGKFLKNYGNVDFSKVRLYMMLYQDLNEDICKKFWEENIDLPLTKFNKTQYIKGKDHPTKRLSYGICNINICSRELKEKIHTWIDLWFDKIVRE